MRSVGTALNKGVDAFGRPITAVTGIPTPQVSVPTTAGTGAGQADLARITANTTLQRQLAKIAANDRTVADAIRAAATGSAQGRQRLITALANARDDVTAIGPHTRTAPGRKALIDALTGRVSNGKTTLTSASADNRTQAARVANASYPTSRTGGSGFQMPQFQMPQIPTTGSGSGTGSGSAGSGLGAVSQPVRTALSRARKVRRSTKRTGATDLADRLVGSPKSSSAAAQRGVAAAKQGLTKRGLPYVWGGTGPRGYDCSGLTQDAWRKAGVEIGRTSEDQFRKAPVRVPLSQVRAGDLVFSNFGSRGPGHVQLAISSTQVVEAQQRGVPIKISDLSSTAVVRRPIRG
ncbi:C40 family peptidase [Tsukamurella ocularis]|uniref:C40 family peptidase n=1 Tax=Tsukamurella ocularis TaxID=1970234 RepID=UPI00216A002E|nr:C40 family peptidase [Tsukamurella ocularis]MCS3853316.1 cell wall-associated NlpC family hydrolase [Tsukamurella ocularis]